MTHIQTPQKQPVEACVHRAPEKSPARDTARDREPVREAQCDSVDPRTTAVPTQPSLQALQPQNASTDRVSTLSSFLQSCMKLLRNQNALKELQKVLVVTDP